MSGRGRNSDRRGLETKGVTVQLTPDEIAKLDGLRRSASHRHFNYVLESRADVLRRLIQAAAVENSSNQVTRRQERR